MARKPVKSVMILFISPRCEISGEKNPLSAGKKDRVGARLGGRPLWVRSGRLFCGLDRKCAWSGDSSAKQKRINTKYGLDIHYYRSAAAGSGVGVL